MQLHVFYYYIHTVSKNVVTLIYVYKIIHYIFFFVDQYEPLLDKSVLLSLYKAFIRSTSFLSQSLALEAFLQATKMKPLWFLTPEGSTIIQRCSEFISSSFKDLQLHAIGILAELSTHITDENLMIIRTYQKALPIVVQALKKSPEHQMLGLSLIQGISKSSCLQEQITASGVFEFLLQSISSEDKTIQLSAMETLNQISSTNSNNTNSKRDILCRSSIVLSKLLDLSKDYQTEQSITKQAVETIVSLAMYDTNKLRITQAGAIEPLIAMCLTDLDLHKAKSLILSFCDCENIQIKVATALALLHLSKKRKILVKLNEIELHKNLLDMLIQFSDEKLHSLWCSTLGRLAANNDEVKSSFMSESNISNFLKIISNTENSSLQSDVVSLFGCALMSNSKFIIFYQFFVLKLNFFVNIKKGEDVIPFRNCLADKEIISVWKYLLTTNFAPLRHRVLSILRLIIKSEGNIEPIKDGITSEFLFELETSEKDPKIQKDIRILLKDLGVQKNIGLFFFFFYFFWKY